MNKLIFWIIGFSLLGFGALILSGSFGPKSYLTISIVTVIMLIIVKVLSFGDILVKQKKKKEGKTSFEWSIKNIIFIIIALLFMILMISYGFMQADIDKVERKIKYQKMSLSELGHYITDINHNNGIDVATYIEKSEYDNERIRFYYIVTKGILFKSLIFMGEGREVARKEIIEGIRQEDCSKTAFVTFLEKGGVMQYIYHEKDDNNQHFLFDVNITYDMCLK